MTREEAMAKAKEFASRYPSPQLDKFEREKFEAQYAARLQFYAAFNEWLRLRSDGEKDETDEQQNERCDRKDDLAHLILTTPAVYDWMIFRKFEVVDYIITKHGEATYVELMALTALSAIKADILRFGLMREEKYEEELRTEQTGA
jgi:hypothetical protein